MKSRIDESMIDESAARRTSRGAARWNEEARPVNFGVQEAAGAWVRPRFDESRIHEPAARCYVRWSEAPGRVFLGVGEAAGASVGVTPRIDERMIYESAARWTARRIEEAAGASAAVNSKID